MTLPGAPPPPLGHPPYAIIPNYLYTIVEKFLCTDLRHRMRPRPQRGQGWRKGGRYLLKKKSFLQSKNFQ